MFTGIVTAYEEIKTITNKNGNTFFDIATPEHWHVEVGESVLVNGVCSTVLESDSASFQVEYMPETLRLTTVGMQKEGSRVNLERSMKLDDLLSGYVVYGHIDGMGTVDAIEEDGDSHIITLTHSAEFDRYIISKGAIVINGVALTAINPKPTQFQVAIIPHTWEHTNLQHVQVGDRVNLEYDVIAKYIEKIYGTQRE